jgi:hypothetical protein
MKNIFIIPQNKPAYCCVDGIITCPGCDGEKESEFGVCAGCEGVGLVGCGKCGGNELKQETLEEGYERVYDSIDYTEFDFTSFKLGAKWQAERMYSEEDLKKAFKVNYTPFSATNIGDFDKDWNKWFEQFKKK